MKTCNLYCIMSLYNTKLLRCTAGFFLICFCLLLNMYHLLFWWNPGFWILIFCKWTSLLYNDIKCQSFPSFCSATCGKSWHCTLPVMVVLMDDRDGARVQVDPEKVGPNLHAALQPVAPLDPSELAVHSVHTHCTNWGGRNFREVAAVTDTISLPSYRDKWWFVKAPLTWALRLGSGVKVSFCQDLPSLEAKTAVRMRHFTVCGCSFSCLYTVLWFRLCVMLLRHS